MDVRRFVAYRIDCEDRLAEVGAGWTSFAASNGGESLAPSRVLGRSLWEFLSDATTIHIYQTMIRQLRQGREPIRFRFRCDAAATRRLLAMEITAGSAGGVLFTVLSEREQERSPPPLLDPAAARDDRLVVMCGWCNRIEVAQGVWSEVEDAVSTLGLFDGAPLPGLTHGICGDCHAAVMGVVEAPDPGAAGIVTVAGLAQVRV